MTAISEILGSKLISQKGETISTDSLAGKNKVLALYFSAHWCPPCRGFTPVLKEFYENVKSSENGNNFDIVFVSSDREESQFDEYFGEMPWKALPYAERDLKVSTNCIQSLKYFEDILVMLLYFEKAKVSKKFKVSGIPTLVFLDAETGKLITDEGRNIVGDDKEGKNFPWRPKPFSEIFKGKL